MYTHTHARNFNQDKNVFKLRFSEAEKLKTLYYCRIIGYETYLHHTTCLKQRLMIVNWTLIVQ